MSPGTCTSGSEEHCPGLLGNSLTHLDVSTSRKVSDKETLPGCEYLHITKLKSKFSYSCLSNVAENMYFHTLPSAVV